MPVIFLLPNHSFSIRFDDQTDPSSKIDSISFQNIDSSSSKTLIDPNSLNDDPSVFDQMEISTLIHGLIQRVEAFEKPELNLIDYLSYLFAKFTSDENDCQRSKSMFDTSNFVHHVCQTFVRHLSASDSSNTNDPALSETLVREYHPDDHSSSIPLTPANSNLDQEIWLVVDLESKEETNPDATSHNFMANNDSNVSEEEIASIGLTRTSELSSALEKKRMPMIN